MLGDVHRSIEAMVSRAVGQTEVTVVFGRPVEPENTVDVPVVGMWLADIREDKAGRSSDWQPAHDGDGAVAGWVPPLRRYHLSYLVTVWARSYEAEVEVLGILVRQLGGTDGMDPDCHRGWLESAAGQVRVSVADPAHSAAEGWGIWSALGAPARTALFLHLTIPVRSDDVDDAGVPVTSRRLSLDGQFFDSKVTETLEPTRRDEKMLARRRGTISREG